MKFVNHGFHTTLMLWIIHSLPYKKVKILLFLKVDSPTKCLVELNSGYVGLHYSYYSSAGTYSVDARQLLRELHDDADNERRPQGR